MSAALATMETMETMEEESPGALSATKQYTPTFKSGKWQLTPERERIMREHFRPGFGGSKRCAELLEAPGWVVSGWATALGLRSEPQKGRKPRGSPVSPVSRGEPITLRASAHPQLVERTLPSDSEAVEALVAVYGRPATDADVPRLPAEIVETLNKLVLEAVRETAQKLAEDVAAAARASAEQHAGELAETAVRREHHALARRIEGIEQAITQLRDEVAETKQGQPPGRGTDERAQRALAMLAGRVWREAAIPESETLSADTEYTLWILAGEQPLAVTQVRPGEKLLIGRAKTPVGAKSEGTP